MQDSFTVDDEGAVTSSEANLCLLMEWTEGTALGKKIRKTLDGEQVKKKEFSDNIVTFI